MTTKKQIKSLWSALAARNDDLLVIGPYIVLKPQRHVMRSISVDRSWDADYPRFYWHVCHAFSPFGSLGALSPEPIYLERGKPDRWSQNGFFDTVFDAIERRFLPMLRRVQTIGDMYRIEGEPRSFEYDHKLNNFLPNRLHVSAALGRFEEAAAVHQEIRRGGAWPRLHFEMADKLGTLVAAGDHAAVAALLHEWERASIERNGLAAIYEKTPFPFEEQG